MKEKIPIVLVLVFISILIILPLSVCFLLSIVSVWSTAIPTDFGLIWWEQVFSNWVYLKAIINTIIVASLSTVATVGYGIIGSYLFTFYEFRGKQFLQTMILSPTYVACLVVSLGLLLTYPFLRNTVWIMILANFIIVSPLVMKYVQSSMVKISPHIVEASSSLGSTKLNTFLRIILPLSKQGILSGTVLSLGMCMSALSVVLILYTPSWATIPIWIYLENSTGRLGVAGALSTLLIIVTIITILLVNRWSDEKWK